MSDTFWTRRIYVTDHALVRVRERLGWEGTDDDVTGAVVAEVRANLAVDRFGTVQPDWTRSNIVERDTVGADFFCWDAAGSRCWPFIEEANGALRVITLLLDYDAYHGLSEARYVRSGMRRV